MRIWKYDASSHTDRLISRLEKYKGGQLLLQIIGDDYHGQLTDFSIEGVALNFELEWLAKRHWVSRSVWSPKWRWDLIEFKWPAKDSGFVIVRTKTINLEMANSQTSQNGPDGHAKAFAGVGKFYQDKSGTVGVGGKKLPRPKCLFFTTTIGEKGILFQPNDPRNLRLDEGAVIDPLCPQD